MCKLPSDSGGDCDLKRDLSLQIGIIHPVIKWIMRLLYVEEPNCLKLLTWRRRRSRRIRRGFRDKPPAVQGGCNHQHIIKKYPQSLSQITPLLFSKTNFFFFLSPACPHLINKTVPAIWEWVSSRVASGYITLPSSCDNSHMGSEFQQVIGPFLLDCLSQIYTRGWWCLTWTKSSEVTEKGASTPTKTASALMAPAAAWASLVPDLSVLWLRRHKGIQRPSFMN